ncbi:MAG: regulatory protein RecX [Trueperaceae bacterium]
MKLASRQSKPYTYERAWNYATWLLSRHAYSKAQIKEKLVKKQVASEIVEKVLVKLEDYRFINDASYAEQYVESRQKRKGRIALKRELQQKGLEEKLVEQTLSRLDDETQQETALELLKKQLHRFQKDEPRKRYGKMYTFLARRGFTSDVIRAVLEGLEPPEDEIPIT